MTFAIKVNGGTGAGTKRAPLPKPRTWTCERCHRVLAGHWVRCPDDGTRRP